MYTHIQYTKDMRCCNETRHDNSIISPQGSTTTAYNRTEGRIALSPHIWQFACESSGASGALLCVCNLISMKYYKMNTGKHHSISSRWGPNLCCLILCCSNLLKRPPPITGHLLCKATFTKNHLC